MTTETAEDSSQREVPVAGSRGQHGRWVLRWTTATLGAVVLLSVVGCCTRGTSIGTAEAIELSDSQIVIGGLFRDQDPTCKPVTVEGEGPFTIAWAPNAKRPDWQPGLVMPVPTGPLVAGEKRAVPICVNKARQKPSTRTYTRLAFTDATGTQYLVVRISCTQQSKCGVGPSPAPTTTGTAPRATTTARPTTVPTARPTTMPTARPSEVPTVRPSAAPTSVPPPNESCQGTSTPRRYTCAEVSLELERVYDKSNPFKWDPRDGCTATEYTRRKADGMRLVCLRRLQNALDKLGGPFAYRASKVENKVFYQLKSELASYVFGISLKDGERGGHWSIDLNGFYGHSGAGIGDVVYTVLSAKTPERMAAAAALPADLLALMDVEKTAAGDLVKRTARVLPAARPFDSVRSRLGMIQTHLPRIAPSAACRAAIHDVHECHRQSARFNCGVADKPTCATRDLHIVAEEVCGRDCGEECMNLVAMREFYADPDHDDPTTPEKDGWTQEEVCAWFLIADGHHEAWHREVLDWQRPFSWAFIEIEDENHARDHDALTRYGDQKFTWYDQATKTWVTRIPSDYVREWMATHPLPRREQGMAAVEIGDAPQKLAVAEIDGTRNYLGGGQP